jgi:hypothetical protein
MNQSVGHELRLAFPAWALALLLPAPAVLTVRDAGVGLIYFFVACMGLVADIFWRHESSGAAGAPRGGLDTWRRKLATAAIALVAAWLGMAAMCLTLPQSGGIVAATLALLAVIAALCIVPYLLATVGNPFIAVFFSLTLVACMKLLGCVVVVLVYGWDASERGYTAMPWTRPNLLVWSFLAFTGALSAICFWRGVRLAGDEKPDGRVIACDLPPKPQWA